MNIRLMRGAAATNNNAPERNLTIIIVVAAVLFSSAPSMAQDSSAAACILAGGQFGQGVACLCRDASQGGRLVAGNLDRIANNEMYCGSNGWTQMFPMTNIEACPFQVQRFWPEQDGKCGNAATGSDKVPQRFFQARFDLYVCYPHDLGYSDCSADKAEIDANWMTNTYSVCNNYYGGTWKYDWCVKFGKIYFDAIVGSLPYTAYKGEKSWRDAHYAVCQCGADGQPCGGGQPRFCVNCPGNEVGGDPLSAHGIMPEASEDPFYGPNGPCPGGC